MASSETVSNNEQLEWEIKLTAAGYVVDGIDLSDASFMAQVWRTLGVAHDDYPLQSRVRSFIKQQQARSGDNPPAVEDIKTLADFARQAMDSSTDKRDMSKASSQWAQELVAALGIVVRTEDVNEDAVEKTAEPPGYLWQVTTTAGDTVKISEHQGTPGARNWFRNHFLSGDDLEKKGYTCVVVTGHLLPRLKAGGKGCSGKGDMVIGKKTSIDFADSVYEQAPGLIELKTDEYPIKVGQIILELTAFSMVSRFGRGVVLLASDCNTKWRLAWFQDYNTICRRNYVSGRKCWLDFKDMLVNAEERGTTMQPPLKKRLAALNEDQVKETDDDQNLEGFEESDVKQKAVDREAFLHQLANRLGDVYGERPIVPDWAKAKTTVPDYYT